MLLGSLEQSVVICAGQDRSDVNRIPRYLWEYTHSRGWPLNSNTVGMVETILQVTSMHLHLSQFSCNLWAEIQSDSTLISACSVW